MTTCGELKLFTFSSNLRPYYAYTLANMLDRRLELNAGYNQIVWQQWQPLTQFTEQVFLGSFAWTCPASKRRFLYKPNITDYGAGWVTPSDIARDYLHVKFTKPFRATKGQLEAVREPRLLPIHAEKCSLADAVYLDIRSAYWSILSVVGIDVQYHPNRWLAVRSDVNDFPFPNHKLARNCLVTIGLTDSIRYWDGKSVKQEKKHNRYKNDVLWALVSDVLKAVAQDMLSVGAVYVHTDGYILPAEKERAGIETLEEWGLVGRVKERGYAQIYGVGCYDIGNRRTQFPRKLLMSSHSNIVPQDFSWLKKRFARFAEARKDGG